jgi:hypothetical protein
LNFSFRCFGFIDGSSGGGGGSENGNCY